MEKIFKCDCGTHLIQFEYTKPEKDFDYEDFSVCIYDVYNPETGRSYKNPRLIGDIVLLNNKYPRELDGFFNFMQMVIDNRKKTDKEVPVGSGEEDKNLEKAIVKIKEIDKKRKEQDKLDIEKK